MRRCTLLQTRVKLDDRIQFKAAYALTDLEDGDHGIAVGTVNYLHLHLHLQGGWAWDERGRRDVCRRVPNSVLHGAI